MYVSLEDFEQNVGKYMMLAKKVDLFIVDSTNTTVWTLRCRQNTLQARLAKVLGDAYGAELLTTPSAEGYYSSDSFRPVCSLQGCQRTEKRNRIANETGKGFSI